MFYLMSTKKRIVDVNGSQKRIAEAELITFAEMRSKYPSLAAGYKQVANFQVASGAKIDDFILVEAKKSDVVKYNSVRMLNPTKKVMYFEGYWWKAVPKIDVGG